MYSTSHPIRQHWTFKHFWILKVFERIILPFLLISNGWTLDTDTDTDNIWNKHDDEADLLWNHLWTWLQMYLYICFEIYICLDYTITTEEDPTILYTTDALIWFRKNIL